MPRAKQTMSKSSRTRNTKDSENKYLDDPFQDDDDLTGSNPIHSDDETREEELPQHAIDQEDLDNQESEPDTEEIAEDDQNIMNDDTQMEDANNLDTQDEPTPKPKRKRGKGPASPDIHLVETKKTGKFCKICHKPLECRNYCPKCQKERERSRKGKEYSKESGMSNFDAESLENLERVLTNALLEINRVKELHRSRELARDENKTLGKRKRSPGTVQNTKTDGRKRTRKNQELSELPLPSIKPQRKKTTTSLNLGKYNLKKIDGNEGEAIVDTIASEFQTPRNLNFKHTSTKDSVDRSLPKRNQKKRSPLNAPDENLDNEFETEEMILPSPLPQPKSRKPAKSAAKNNKKVQFETHEDSDDILSTSVTSATRINGKPPSRSRVPPLKKRKETTLEPKRRTDSVRDYEDDDDDDEGVQMGQDLQDADIEHFRRSLPDTPLPVAN